MRLVVGSVLVMRSGLRMWSDPPPTDVTIPAVLLLVAGIMMIAGLWTPIAGTSIALIETWKMLTLTGDKSVWLLLGTASAALAMLGPGFGPSMLAFSDGNASKSLLEKVALTLLNRAPQIRPKFLASKEGCYSLPKSLRFAPMWG